MAKNNTRSRVKQDTRRGAPLAGLTGPTAGPNIRPVPASAPKNPAKGTSRKGR